jgi:hypothetical protein
MTMKPTIILGLICLLALTLALGSAVLAQTGYRVAWWTIDGGGASSSGGGYRLGGTAGQHDAGRLTGGNYTLAGGFWSGSGGAGPRHALLLPVVRR